MISTSTKKRVLVGFIVFLGFWPIVHHVFVTRYEMDAWKYFGMSMYAMPRTIAAVPSSLEIAFAGEQFQAIDLTPRLERVARRLARHRVDYGTLYRPEVIVAEMFQILPAGIDRLAFFIGFLRLDSEAMLEQRVVRTECQKGIDQPEDGQGIECRIVR
jgi:hypothetical protein